MISVFKELGLKHVLGAEANGWAKKIFISCSERRVSWTFEVDGSKFFFLH